MALFNLANIKIENIPDGFVSDRFIGSEYDYNTYRYPIDLGSPDKAHYMVIHINEQVKTQFPSQTTGDTPSVIQNQQSFGAKTGLQSITNSVKDITTFIEKNSEIKQSLILNEQKGVRTIRRTSDTIALYMPDTLNFTYNQQYSSVNMQGLPAIVAGVSEALKQVMGGNIKEAAKNIAAFVGNEGIRRFFGDGAGAAAFQSLTGLVVNPQLELVYSSPEFRSFRFDFMFYPRSSAEAKEVQNIISRLRFHQAPEIKQDTGAFFLVPPSEFDIKFYYNGRENENIPKISTCILTTIDTDYAPNGWASYERPGEFNPSVGGTGMPVAIRLSLGFQEVEFMTKDNFASDRSKNIRELEL